jgi:exodeoxyribonuclease VII large subunit
MTLVSRRNMAINEPIFYSISEFNALASETLNQTFGLVWLRGEISSLTRAGSGHLYLSVKDANAVVRAVIFRTRQAYCEFDPQVGDQVELQAKVGLYEPRGEFQLNIQRLRRAGRGTLHEQFEQLKQTLQAQGLFDLQNKRAISPTPSSIGVVTSLGAAALHDVLTTLKRRAPHVSVIIYPSLVQGAQAPLALRRALAQANARLEVDTILLVRGGGSFEDLWAFNDESLARDIAASVLPVVCGVGHESDITIADFVADLRAPTPTAAAEQACAPTAALLDLLRQRHDIMSDRMLRLIERLSQRVDRLGQRLVNPAMRLSAQANRLGLLIQRLRYAKPDTSASATQIQRGLDRMHQLTVRRIERLGLLLDHRFSRLLALSHTAVLQRGYAIVQTSDGQIVRDAYDVRTGDPLGITLAKGRLSANVVACSPEAGDG